VLVEQDQLDHQLIQTPVHLTVLMQHLGQVVVMVDMVEVIIPQDLVIME
jgi:hypothetical protein